jgi:hypothetical protein
VRNAYKEYQMPEAKDLRFHTAEGQADLTHIGYCC